MFKSFLIPILAIKSYKTAVLFQGLLQIKMKTHAACLLFLLFTSLFFNSRSVFAQSISLHRCLEAAEKNYPVSSNRTLLDALRDYNIENAYSGKKPQVSLIAQATYQSDVTRIPIESPQFKVPTLAKDQYRAYAEVSQSIYDGGTSAATAAVQEKQLAIERQSLEVEIEKLRERVIQLYFGVLLTGKQMEQTSIMIQDFDEVLKKLDHSVEEGVVLRINADLVRAEKIRSEQRRIEQASTRKIWAEALELLTGFTISEKDLLTEPDLPVVESGESSRPEIGLFRYQEELVNQQLALTLSRNTLKAGAFLQAGYGRPGLNMLLNEFDTYYLAGLRLNWNLSGQWTQKNDRLIAGSRLKMLKAQQETFRINNRIQQRQYAEEFARLNQLILLDEEHILLRNRIQETIKVQLENGVVTASDYLREANALDQARLTLILHRIQRNQAAHQHKLLIGD